jgi:cation:H+ antiporter
VRIGAYDLAIGNLFGSNMFNIFALGATDLFFVQGRFLSSVDPVMTLAGIMALLLTTMGLIGNVARIEKRILFVELDALAIMVSYGFFMWMLYQRGLVV